MTMTTTRSRDCDRPDWELYFEADGYRRIRCAVHDADWPDMAGAHCPRYVDCMCPLPHRNVIDSAERGLERSSGG